MHAIMRGIHHGGQWHVDHVVPNFRANSGTIANEGPQERRQHGIRIHLRRRPEADAKLTKFKSGTATVMTTRHLDEPGRPATERCMQCGGIDTVVVSTFRWHETSHLSWRCKRCRRMWVTPERRKTTRRPED